MCVLIPRGLCVLPTFRGCGRVTWGPGSKLHSSEGSDEESGSVECTFAWPPRMLLGQNSCVLAPERRRGGESFILWPRYKWGGHGLLPTQRVDGWWMEVKALLMKVSAHWTLC